MRNSPMRNIIAGTAGHIDHGKTALVRALTGIETDRLEEEKRRGISIDLGFAHLDLGAGLSLGFVDVPGHERFVKNMLAGAAGIDVVLLVIAADESIMPQTREHFDICRLLGVSRGLVVLTKADLVDRDILDLVRLEVEEFVEGSFLAGAPIVPVSSVTGEGIGELKNVLAGLVGGAAGKDVTRPFRLPVDRAFSMRGFGTVITGTLVAGSIAVEQEVEAHPTGKKLRIRGVQVHGAMVDRAFAGQRTALNLAGAEARELRRGLVLTEPGLFRTTERVDCVFHLLPNAKPLKHRAPVHFHAGTAELEAEVRLSHPAEPVQPGATAYARFLLADPLLLLPGDRFIIRMFSPVVTIGGGAVIDIAPPARPRGIDMETRLRALERGSTAERIALLVREASCGLGVEALVARTGLRVDEIEQAAIASGQVLVFAEPQIWLLDRGRLAQWIERVESALAAFHREQPLAAGIAKGELRSRDLPDAPVFLLDAMLRQSPGIAVEGEAVRLASHRLHLRQDEEEAQAKIEEAFARAGLAVPATSEVLGRCGVEPGRARALLQILIRHKKLVRISEDLVFHSATLEDLRALLARRKGERFLVPAFKDWTGVSRKYAIPLLEYLDRERVTRRDGDSRVVL